MLLRMFRYFIICRHVSQGSLGLRHWCEQGDNLKQFGWNKHDGREFGIQNIVDRGVNIETSFVKVKEAMAGVFYFVFHMGPL